MQARKSDEDLAAQRLAGSGQGPEVAVVSTGRDDEIFVTRVTRVPELGIDSVWDEGKLAARDAKPFMRGLQMVAGVEDHTVDPALHFQKLEEGFFESRQQLVADHDMTRSVGSSPHRDCERDSKVLAVGKHDVVLVQLPPCDHDMTE
jgi:hypothetical protein